MHRSVGIGVERAVLDVSVFPFGGVIVGEGLLRMVSRRFGSIGRASGSRCGLLGLGCGAFCSTCGFLGFVGVGFIVLRAGRHTLAPNRTETRNRSRRGGLQFVRVHTHGQRIGSLDERDSASVAAKVNVLVLSVPDESGGFLGYVVPFIVKGELNRVVTVSANEGTVSAEIGGLFVSYLNMKYGHNLILLS